MSDTFGGLIGWLILFGIFVMLFVVWPTPKDEDGSDLEDG